MLRSDRLASYLKNQEGTDNIFHVLCRLQRKHTIYNKKYKALTPIFMLVILFCRIIHARATQRMLVFLVKKNPVFHSGHENHNKADDKIVTQPELTEEPTMYFLCVCIFSLPPFFFKKKREHRYD